jgi:hypothetical protein
VVSTATPAPEDLELLSYYEGYSGSCVEVQGDYS